jgi:RNA methyltransferase, TrmH family
MIISSRQNPLIRELRTSVHAPSRRSGVCVIEGWRLLGAALEAGVHFDLLVMTQDAASAAGAPAAVRARARAASPGMREIAVTPDVFAALTQVEAPQGILAVAPRPPAAPLASSAGPDTLAVVLDAVQDPGNVGTIVRTAVACRATALVACGATADPFGPKALRASAGAAFRLPIAFAREAAEADAALRRAGLRIVVADAHAPDAATRATWTTPLALVLGSEAAGPAPVWREHGAAAVRVPVAGPVESLNVAAAAAVLLYQAAGLLIAP